MGIDHGGFDVFVAKQFLNSTNVVAILQEMGGKGVAEGVGGNRFGYFRKAGGLLNSSLQIGLIQMVAPFDTADRINREHRRRKDILPGKFTVGVQVLFFQDSPL